MLQKVDQAIYLVSTSQAPEEAVNEIDNKIGKVILCTQELMGSKADELKKNKNGSDRFCFYERITNLYL